MKTKIKINSKYKSNNRNKVSQENNHQNVPNLRHDLIIQVVRKQTDQSTDVEVRDPFHNGAKAGTARQQCVVGLSTGADLFRRLVRCGGGMFALACWWALASSWIMAFPHKNLHNTFLIFFSQWLLIGVYYINSFHITKITGFTPKNYYNLFLIINSIYCKTGLRVPNKNILVNYFWKVLCGVFKS